MSATPRTDAAATTYWATGFASGLIDRMAEIEADLARVTVERDAANSMAKTWEESFAKTVPALRARVAELEAEIERWRTATAQLRDGADESARVATEQLARAEQRNAELEASLRDLLGEYADHGDALAKIARAEQILTRAKPAAPAYRQLIAGEIIQPGDEIDACVNAMKEQPRWEPVTQCIGEPAPDPSFPAHRIYRRRIEPAAPAKDCASPRFQCAGMSRTPIADYLRDYAHAIDIGESQEAAQHAQWLRKAVDAIEAAPAKHADTDRHMLAKALMDALDMMRRPVSALDYDAFTLRNKRAIDAARKQGGAE